LAATRRQQALELAEELLGDIELSRIPPPDLARKTSRLARLLDDVEALQWLHFEIAGYPVEADNTLAPLPWSAAMRSNRAGLNEGKAVAYTTPLGQIQAHIDAAMTQLQAAADRPVSVTSANPHQFVQPPAGNTLERSGLRNFIGDQRALLDKVVGSLHVYASSKYQELRFGSAVETAFEVVRQRVDASISALVPEALPKLAAAFENASSDNPEHRANAAATCRRLLKAAADALRPPGADVDGRKMGEDEYINRLVDWITEKATSDTAAAMMVADLEHLGPRLDAALDAGHKGTHAEIGIFEASRFVTGTYLVLGDILELHRPDDAEAEPDSGGQAKALSREASPLDAEDLQPDSAVEG
jgi:hypothetical protein